MDGGPRSGRRSRAGIYSRNLWRSARFRLALRPRCDDNCGTRGRSLNMPPGRVSIAAESGPRKNNKVPREASIFRQRPLRNVAPGSAALLQPSWRLRARLRWAMARKRPAIIRTSQCGSSCLYGPGGAGDLTIRLLGDKLSQSLKQPFVIREPARRPEASPPSGQCSEAPADGYTLGVMGNGQAITASLFRDLPYNVLNDFAQISVAANFEMLLAVPPTSPYRVCARPH